MSNRQFLRNIDASKLISLEDVNTFLENQPEGFGDWLQNSRYLFNELVVKDLNKQALLLSELIIENSEYAEKLIWLIQDLLGRDPKDFLILNLKPNSIDSIKTKIKDKLYTNYPFVILARYVQPKYRKELVHLIIDYADQNQNSMSWAMTGEACETLGFLNCKPEDSMKCLSRHLNDNGCDDMPLGNILKVLPVFKNQINIILKELIYLMRNDLHYSSGGYVSYFYETLSNLILSKSIAIKLLPLVVKDLKSLDIKDEIIQSRIYEECNDEIRAILLFYGQLQAIINNDL